MATTSWLCLLLAILAIACLAEDDHLSMRYGDVALRYLFLNDLPIEPSIHSLKAMILIIYSRVHDGENVLRYLDLAHHMANSIELFIRTSDPIVCEEYSHLLIGLKALYILNTQIHDSNHHRDLTRYRSRLSPRAEVSSLTQMTFTILNFDLLIISDAICLEIEQDLVPEQKLAGFETKLKYMWQQCNKLYAEVNGSDLKLESHRVGHHLLRYHICYLMHLLFLPHLQRCLEGDIRPRTRSFSFKCTIFGMKTLQMFISLAMNKNCQQYARYIRCLGSYYAFRSADTVRGAYKKLQSREKQQEARFLLNRTYKIFSETPNRTPFFSAPPTDVSAVAESPSSTNQRSSHLEEVSSSLQTKRYILAQQQLRKDHTPAADAGERRSTRLSVIKPPEKQGSDHPYSYWVYQALSSSFQKGMPIQEIYTWLEKRVYHTRGDKGWKNSIRHNLSMNSGFKIIRMEKAGKRTVGCWGLTEEAIKNGKVQPTTRYRNVT
ncbi:hypothetical protein N7495_001982 [Penicillium taxi]|uniref:uncharacterized protein n=1 Tax=Penicillium taxi TaxID=168475 RepID=UPI0025456559|nr:uncharacterized protein N7495_001982 [Penicillium taxi]KAJ5901454.1 hypothetical protein N7495_001982 [Penicillium taxi]